MGKGKVLSFMLEEIEGLVMGPLRIVSKEIIYFGMAY